MQRRSALRSLRLGSRRLDHPRRFLSRIGLADRMVGAA
ncbi:hypothetical protein CSB93_2131 [Pseudomonas paraeruginosa]|uniref:Uncharacterized protein n=1 Tax=Pseudomonas paraeruginosa TaxID=2994495 RepID=A0A2R3IVX0_9PSED|nr:hypothetical protein CSB93_2131 [Pseudomonas paraeruginosa]AWE92508.1 hypothetical protein CSC28_0897 [Pseudomonas paraeruginosa]